MPSSHALLIQPSSLKRSRVCAAFAVIARHGDRVGEDTPHPNTLRGTLMHGVAEDVLNDWLKGLPTSCADFKGRTYQGQRFTVIEEKETEGYVKYVKKRVAEDPDSMVFLEQRLYFHTLVGLTDPEEAFGSGDCVIVQPNLKRIVVIDLKTGKWAVEVLNNDQLLTYGLGALRKFNMFADIDEVEIVIYQRRADSFTVSKEWLRSWGVALRRDVQRIKQCENIYLKTKTIPIQYYVGGEHCQFCQVVTCPRREEEIWRK